MADIITLTGLVATDPKNLVTREGLSITSFRLASTQRRYDRTQNKWIDGDTNWYSVSSFRQLAGNVLVSLRKGDRVVVTGRLRIREWKNEERGGTTIEVDADAAGPDLAWGTATFSRSMSSSSADSAEFPSVNGSALASDAQPGALAEPGTATDAESVRELDNKPGSIGATVDSVLVDSAPVPF